MEALNYLDIIDSYDLIREAKSYLEMIKECRECDITLDDINDAANIVASSYDEYVFVYTTLLNE